MIPHFSLRRGKHGCRKEAFVGGRVHTDASTRTLPVWQLKKRVRVSGSEDLPDVHLGSHPCPKFRTNSPPGIGLLGWWGVIKGTPSHPGIAGIWGIGHWNPAVSQLAWRDLLTASLPTLTSLASIALAHILPRTRSLIPRLGCNACPNRPLDSDRLRRDTSCAPTLKPPRIPPGT